jgi:hypothetical protein
LIEEGDHDANHRGHLHSRRSEACG